MTGPAGSGVALPSRGVLGMWIFLVTDAAGFGGLLLADGVLRARASVWPDPHQRFSLTVAAILTGALLLSSLTMSLAVDAAQRRRPRATLFWLAVTVSAGLFFVGGQLAEYQHLLSAPVPVRLTTDVAASLFFVITGFHGVHVLAGVVYLAAVFIAEARVKIPSSDRLVVAALFWHFVDFLWVAIFFAIYLLPTN